MQRIIQDMSRINRCGIRYRKEKLEALGISNGHAIYLVHICATPGMTQEQLTRQLYIDKSNVARKVAGMEEAGLVERRPSAQDKRAFCLYPTDKALSLLPQISAVYNDWDDYLAQALEPEELEVFCRLLERMRIHACERLEAQSYE